jgi:hypothetical protein
MEVAGAALGLAAIDLGEVAERSRSRPALLAQGRPIIRAA